MTGKGKGSNQQDAKQPDEGGHKNRCTGEKRFARDDLIPQSWVIQ